MSAEPRADAELILVVEDESDLRESLAVALRDGGYRVLTAANGREALAILHRSSAPPRIILLDLVMPGMNGEQLQAELAKEPSLATLPLVVISGSSDGRRRAERMRAAAYLQKPIALDRLLDLVEEHT